MLTLNHRQALVFFKLQIGFESWCLHLFSNNEEDEEVTDTG